MRYPVVLSIAGSDSGGGAGIQADLKTFAALGSFGTTALTAVTAQNTLGVQAIQELALDLLKAQIDSVATDFSVDSVKIGLLHTPAAVRVVADSIRRYGFTRVVLDPVMVATSGDRLVTPETMSALVRELFPLATVVTPNLDEAGWLLGRALTDLASLEGAAQELVALGARAVLLKGGHLPGDRVVDVLLERDHPPIRLGSDRIHTRNTHGTGCTLSSAIAHYLAIGETLSEAVRCARAYVTSAIAAGATVTTGRGNGPLNHAFGPVPMRIQELEAPR